MSPHEHGPGCGHRKEYAPHYRQASEADDFRWVPDCDCPGKDYGAGFHNKECRFQEAESFA